MCGHGSGNLGKRRGSDEILAQATKRLHALVAFAKEESDYSILLQERCERIGCDEREACTEWNDHPHRKAGTAEGRQRCDQQGNGGDDADADRLDARLSPDRGRAGGAG